MVVRLYSNKIVFTNPGTLLVSKMQYYGESASVCRNKTLQKMFMLIGSAEKREVELIRYWLVGDLQIGEHLC